jgi:hypothetical protein
MLAAPLLIGLLATVPAGSMNHEMSEIWTEGALRNTGFTADVVVTDDVLLVDEVIRHGDGMPVDLGLVAAIVWTQHPQRFEELVVRTVDGPERVFTRNELRTSLGPRPADLAMFPSAESADDSRLAEPFLMPVRILAIGVGAAALALTLALVALALGAPAAASVRRH